MIDLKILAPPNIRYFGDLHPFRKWQKSLRDAGIRVEIYYDHTNKKLLNADRLILHHRYFSNGLINSINTANDTGGDLIKFLIRLKANVGKLIWFDAGDSSGTTQFPIIPFVDVFVKKQVLKDRSYYMGQLNEQKNFMVWSDKTAQQKKFTPCPAGELHKIRVGWNIAFNDYRDFVVHYKLRKYLSYYIDYNAYPIKYTTVNSHRPIDVTFRGKVNYVTTNKVVSDQRNKVLQLFNTLSYKIASGRNLGRSKYLKELTQSKVTISPFGYGEVCFRDFETFISGSLLVKPSMDHLDMFPELFTPNETYVPVSWQLDDLPETLDNIFSNYESYKQIASNGQERYKNAIEGPETFIEALKLIIN